MSGGGLRRFVASAAPERPPGAPDRPSPGAPPPALGVVASPAIATAAGAAVALAAARAARISVALVCVWSPDGAHGSPWGRGPALPGARRLAAALVARDHEARAAGRLALVRLADDEAVAATEAQRALAAGGAAAAVVAVGARSEALDAVLAAQDALVLWTAAEATPPLRTLALAGLQRLGRPAVAVDAVLGPRARMLALAGLATPSGASGAVREVIA